jgi:hypothetical protein
MGSRQAYRVGEALGPVPGPGGLEDGPPNGCQVAGGVGACRGDAVAFQ